MVQRMDGHPAFNHKAFPLHKDAFQFYPDMSALPRILDFAATIPSVAEILGEKPLPQPPVRRLYRKHKAQFNDPICLYGLIEAILRMQRGIYVRPQYLLGELQRDYPLYHWSVSMLGRMLSGFQFSCKEDYPGTDNSTAPIARGRDSHGTYYVVDPRGGNEGILWLVQARKRALNLSIQLMQSESHGDFAFTLGDEAQPGDLYSTRWLQGCAVRSPEFYLAQCDDAPFMGTDIESIRAMGRISQDPLA